MQNVFFHEVEAAYMRRRMQDAVLADSLAAQAIRLSTPRLRHRIPNLILAIRQAAEVCQMPWPMPGTIPNGKDLPIVRG